MGIGIETEHGASRYVVLTRRYAIKMPLCWSWRSFLHGLLANHQERMIYQHAPSGRLCPVLLADPLGFVLVMPRCEPLPEELTEAEYERLVDEDDYRIPAELKSTSFGILDGQIVVIDYGN